MKNHKMVNGKLLQTNKKWSHLAERQKTWIYEVTAKEWAAYVEKHGKLPMKKNKEAVLDAVHDKVIRRDIWIPYHEFKQAVNKKIDRLNRKSPLFVAPQPPNPQQPNCELLANLDRLHTTELGLVRIKNNLELDADDVIAWSRQRIESANNIVRKGKNWYVHVDGIAFTVNAHSYTIITAHKEQSIPSNQN